MIVEYQYVENIQFSFKVVPYISVGWRWTIKKWNPERYEQWEKDEMAWRKFLMNGAFDARGLPIYQMTSKGLTNGKQVFLKHWFHVSMDGRKYI